MYATFSRTLDFSETARLTHVPRQTVHDIVRRLSGDGLADLRQKLRADLAEEAWAMSRDLIRHVIPENMGTERSSKGSESARAALDLAKIAGLLHRVDQPAAGGEALAPVPLITVFTGLAPPPPGEPRDEE